MTALPADSRLQLQELEPAPRTKHSHAASGALVVAAASELAREPSLADTWFLVSDEPVPERRVITVDVEGGVDQVRLVPVAAADRTLAPRVVGLFGEAEHPAGNGPAGMSFWGDLAGEVGRGPAQDFVFLFQGLAPLAQFP